jgi:hypothetical protein
VAGLFAGKTELFLVPEEQSRAQQGPIRPALPRPRRTPDKAGVACPARPRLGRLCWAWPSVERKRPAWPGGDRPSPVADGNGPTEPEREMAYLAGTAGVGPRRVWPKQAQSGRGRSGPARDEARRPSRDSPSAGPGGILPAPAQAGCRCTEMPAQPGPKTPGADRERSYSAQDELVPAQRGQNRYMAAWRREFRPEKDICRPGSAGVDPGPTYVGRDINMPTGTHICRPEEAECRPGDADVDPGQPYAGPGELMSIREAEEDLQCSEAMLMSSPRADDEDPVRMYSYQRLDQPHGGRQMSSW